MSVTGDQLMPAAAGIYSDRQRLFLLYFVGALVDLVVLGLFNEYSDKVYVARSRCARLYSILLDEGSRLCLRVYQYLQRSSWRSKIYSISS